MSYRAEPSSDRHTSSGVRGSKGCLYPGSVAGSFWIDVAVPGTPSVVAPTAVRPVAMIGLQKRDVDRGAFQCSYNDRGMVVLSRPRRCGFDQPGTAPCLYTPCDRPFATARQKHSSRTGRVTAAYLILSVDGVPPLLLLPPCFPFCLLIDSAAKAGYRHLQMLVCGTVEAARGRTR